MSLQFDKLKTLLRELFQLDQPDLDFGFYRIMHAKSAEVTEFLDKDLLPQVKSAFADYHTADKSVIQRELAQAIEQAHSLGADAETLPKVKALRERLANEAVDVTGLEAEVYDHLYSFFRRYYSEGDFLSKRVYKPGVYAIPYEGEEVKLHWANADQYYIKTSEYLRDYAFRLKPDNAADPMRVHFRLVDAAEGEHGNVKETEGKGRAFVLAGGADFMSEVDGEQGKELSIRFEYRPATIDDWSETERRGKTKPPAQKDLLSIADARIVAAGGVALARWIQLLNQSHLRTDGETADYSRLRAHLNRYAARNTFDYFIHKDLGGFLRRELDFYIKNEVMHLDDIENESVPRVEQYLSKIKVIRKIAGKIVEFLASLEDFQKKLWLKKKFVVETSWCVRVGCIPKHFVPEIVANEAQTQEWVRLLKIDALPRDLASVGFTVPLTAEFLVANPGLLVDTRLFDSGFSERMLAEVEDIDDIVDGVVIQSENSQALSILRARYRNSLDAVYADPPYNTDASAINYKNGYRDSSWLALIHERFSRVLPLLQPAAILCITIDDVELHNLRSVGETALAPFQLLGVVPIKNNPAGRTGTVGFSVCHEYALFYGQPGEARIGRLEHSEAQRARYKESDDVSAFEWTNFRKHGGQNTYRSARPRQFYPIYVSGAVIRIPDMAWDNSRRTWTVLDQASPDEETLLPVDDHARERIWDFVVETARANIPHFLVKKDSRGQTAIYRKWRVNDEGLLPQTWWDKSEYSAAQYGTNLLADIFGEAHRFAFPKSVLAVADCLKVAGLRRDSDAAVIDFFGGSGTTGHAVINLNRADGGRRKFILVEMADYMETVLLPRIKKIAFTPDWRGGSPGRLSSDEEAERGPRVLKVIRLESYEDTLGNLDLARTTDQQSLLDVPEAKKPDGLREQYVLRYMLDAETRGSQSLLNVAAFMDPRAYRLKVKRPGSDESREVNVDLLETFNWLIGISVRHLAAPQTFSAEFKRDDDADLPKNAVKRLLIDGRLKEDPAGPWWFRTVTGTTPDGRKTLVIWRTRPGGETPEGVEHDNLVLDTWFEKQGYSSKDSEFDLIYVNGGNNLENLKAPDDTWKVRLIEEDFHRLMFDTEDV